MDLVAVQMVSDPDIADNFAVVEQQLKRYRAQYPDNDALVVLPECFALFGGAPELNLTHREKLAEGAIQQRLAQLAVCYGLSLVGGTLPLDCGEDSRFMACCTVFSPKGQLIADYQKMHLFDVDVSDNTGSYRESATTAAGQKVVVFEIQGIKVGLAVCYDVRFPGLFTALAEQGAEVILLPSAFTCPTGAAHWHCLLRARAIENQVFLVAPGQGGVHANGRETYGHSLIVDPWGEVVAELAAQGPGWVRWPFDREQLERIRRQMPVAMHNRFSSRRKS